jgi:AcrR family transcriptional regulator
MARPLSEEKRDALLAAAASLIASAGIAASTAKIAKAARVSEGTLFVYFPTKEDLLNQLFLELKTDLARAMLASYPETGTARERTQHMWNRLIDWGVANPTRKKALRHLNLCDQISSANRRRADGFFEEIRRMVGECLLAHSDHDRVSFYAGAALDALVETTIDVILARPEDHTRFSQLGFNLFWNGMTIQAS